MNTEHPLNDLLMEHFQKYFPRDKVKARVGNVSESSERGMVLYYVDSRTVMDRLDSVVGPMNWEATHRSLTVGKEHGVVCDLGIRSLDGTFVQKSDGSQPTQFEGFKGALSKSLVRSAVLWGIGRYLYETGQKWVDVEKKYGNWQFVNEPKISKKFAPGNEGDPKFTEEETRRLRQAATKAISEGRLSRDETAEMFREADDFEELMSKYKGE